MVQPTPGPVTAFAEVGPLRIAYETFGRPGDPPVALVMGLGTQMIAWPDEMCTALAGRGYYVIRFDNRDVGLSTHLHGVRAPSPVDVALRRRRPPYRIQEMADDCVGLFDALGLSRVHVVGASMGGFIAQSVAIRHPDRVASLSLLMTSTGSRWVGRARLQLVAQLFRRRRVTDRASAQDAAVATFRLIGSPGYPLDEARLRDTAGRSYDRAYDPPGYFRQLAAVVAQRDRTVALRSLRVPTVVLHGLADPLVSVSGGRALARAIPGARFVAFPGMGHDLPGPLLPQFVAEIDATARRAVAEQSSPGGHTPATSR